MKKQYLAISALVLGVLLALTVGLSQAQGPEPPIGSASETALQDEEGTLAATDVVSNAISYQGVLKENGSPVNGTRTITFTLSSNEACTDTVDTIVKDNVSITDGLFDVNLGVTTNDFNGQRLWLAPEVDGTTIGCQEIMAAPYALSLRPGADIIGDNDTTSMLFVRNSGNGAGLHGVSFGSGEGVLGASVDGPGVEGFSLNGPAIYANGEIQSSAETEIAVSPFNMLGYHNTDLTLRAGGSGHMELRPGAAGFDYVYAPVDLPSVLFGVPTKLKSARICYKCDTAASYINITSVRYIDDSGNETDLISDSTNQSDTSWSCYTLTATTPNEIQGSLFIRFVLSFDGSGASHDIQIGRITLTLEE